MGGGCELTAEGLGQGNLLAEGLEVAADRLQREAADRVGRIAELLEVDDRERAHSDRHPVGADQGEAILRPERAWGNAGALQRFATRHQLALKHRVAAPDQHHRHRRHLVEIGRPHRPAHRDDGMDPRVEHLDERREDVRVGT